MTIQLTEDLEQRLDHLASAQQRPSGDLIVEVLQNYVRHIESLAAELDEAEAEADQVGWRTNEEVFARLSEKYKAA